MSQTKEKIALPVPRWDHSDICHITFQTIVGVRSMVGSVKFSVLTVIKDHFSPNRPTFIFCHITGLNRSIHSPSLILTINLLKV